MISDYPAILLVEKDEVTLELYRRELRKSFTVFACTDTNNILEILVKHEIQAVIIEPEVCSGQGWDLIDSIQAAVPGRCIPVIVCSTRDANPKGPGREAARYLTKPVLPRVLREQTLDVLGLKESLRRHS